MVNKIIKYDSGIQGYTVKGVIGEDGNEGNSLYYTVYSIYDITSSDYNTVITRIANGKSLDFLGNDSIEYHINDTIIDCTGKMYTIRLSDDTFTLSYSGDIINQTTYNDTTKDTYNTNIKLESIVKATINNDKYENDNVIYIRYFEYNCMEFPVLRCEFSLENTSDNSEYKIIINYKCGVTEEYSINTNDKKIYIYIPKKYIFMLPNNEKPLFNIDRTSDWDIHIPTVAPYCEMYLEVYNKDTNLSYRQIIKI